MAIVRIFLLTCRRPALLPRAVESLRRQSFTDWVCEVCNDEPADPFPAELLASLGDARFKLTPFPRLGATAAFNRAHRPAPEPYQSILEDDNWWEPTFLEMMIAALERHPAAELAWSNMRIWEELPDHSWSDTGSSVWTIPADSPERTFSWPQLLQFSEALYSNGAMLLRSRSASALILPDWAPFDIMEQIRERCMAFPVLLVPRPLANYSLTLRTARPVGALSWGLGLALIGASFLANVPMTPAAHRALWLRHRRQHPRATNNLILAGLLQRDFNFLRSANAADWIAFLKSSLRRPGTAWRILRARQERPELWEFLQRQGSARTREAFARGWSVLDLPSLLDKRDPGDCGFN